jgi:hypothetical protein
MTGLSVRLSLMTVSRQIPTISTSFGPTCAKLQAGFSLDHRMRREAHRAAGLPAFLAVLMSFAHGGRLVLVSARGCGYASVGGCGGVDRDAGRKVKSPREILFADI